MGKSYSKKTEYLWVFLQWYFASGPNQTNITLKQRILDMESQLESAVHLWDLFINRLQSAFYLYQISVPKWRRALAHFNVFPTAVLEGKYRKKILLQHICFVLVSGVPQKPWLITYFIVHVIGTSIFIQISGAPYLLDGYFTSLNVAKFCCFMNKLSPQLMVIVMKFRCLFCYVTVHDHAKVIHSHQLELSHWQRLFP